jgi:hypothetical protein
LTESIRCFAVWKRVRRMEDCVGGCGCRGLEMYEKGFRVGVVHVTQVVR